MKVEKDIDKLFKEGLENPDLPFNEMDWVAMDKKLDKADKRRVIPFFWISAAAGVAAMLLIAFLVFNSSQKPVSQFTNKNKINLKKNTEIIEAEKSREKINETLADKSPEKNNLKFIEADGFLTKKTNKRNEPSTAATEFQDSSLSTNTQMLLNNTVAQIQLVKPYQLKTDLASTRLNTKIITKPTVLAKLESTQRKPSVSLSFVAAPDITSVRGSGQGNLSGSLGLEATVSISKRLSITSGVSYAKKLYDSDFSLYNPITNYIFKNQPSNIHANCDVLDIPINVNYKLFSNNRNSLVVTSGLSSYLMLKERYDYTYQNSYASGPSSYQIRNQNQHLLGIANVGVTFQHKINNKFAVGISPFMKIPLTNIGYGNSKLSSTGVAISVNMTDIFNKK
ncbi:hypothetical protein [Pedobacter sp.]|uniref:hypothetical protein n=1 Tax=Pedobacter sp. TaxID=1411316 RepID=UPI003BAB9574